MGGMEVKIDKPGLYEVSAEDYHRTEICVGPSISSSGLRAVLDCPAKYWFNSPLNPERPPESSAPHFTLGKAAHDLVLDGAAWPNRYHVLPEGFTRAASKKFASEIQAADEAEAAGKILLKHDDHIAVMGMAEAIKRHPIHKALGRGKAEPTLVWQDTETGVWLRCRPDFLPTNNRAVPDYKTTTSARPEDFSRSVADYGYHQQAALYLDGIEAVFGPLPDGKSRQFYFIAQEKTPPYIVQPFALDQETVEWGRRLNRKAIRTFARCLESGRWPGYADDFVTVGLPRWKVGQLEQTFTE